MKHPLNKTKKQQYAEYIWSEADKAYKWGNRYILGDRSVHPGIFDEWIGTIVDEDIVDVLAFDSREEALEWLYQAAHQEYGCRLWCDKL